ncbi:MAG: RtcB family protein [Deltaproteobacteria bacterium]|nr:RtcB family protein [Deltaproteobacteria bacterium]
MRTDALIYLHEAMTVEQEALAQVRDSASIDADATVLATPDIHTGYGVPIGSILASPGFVSPAAVGYDINCGMRLMLTPFDARSLDVKAVADAIRRELPLGEGKANARFALKPAELDKVLAEGLVGLCAAARGRRELASFVDPEIISANLRRVEDGGALDGDPAAVSTRAKERGAAQLGTLGGGNHFVEIQEVERVDDGPAAAALGLRLGQAVVMIHSGSRGLGHEVAGRYMRLAAATAKALGLFIPNRELAYVPADHPDGRAFLGAMQAAANYAYANREAIAAVVRSGFARALGRDVFLPLVYDVSHNVVRRERHAGRALYVHRKGATRAYPASLMRGTDFARLGQPVLIPGSMGTASYVLLGTESAAESLFSVNHGAGRVMSRTAAAGKVRRRDGKILKAGSVSDRRFEETMRGVYLLCEDRSTIKEEAPDAYKDIDLVVDTVVGAGLARVVARLRPLAVLKG